MPGTSSPDVSVVVCTRDRAVSLGRTLASLAEQVACSDSVSWEVVVVDNGSSDDTPQVTEAHRDRLDRLRLVSEPIAGLSRARNRGMQAATGSVIAYLDDDAEVEPGWLAALARRFTDPAVTAVGGPIRLVFPSGRPAWLPHRLEAYYAGLELGDEPRLLGPAEYPFGANMALRAEALRDVGGFDERLGRTGRDLISDEEADLFGRLRQRTGSLWWEPEAAVRHHVPADRSTRGFVVRRAYAQGRSRARRDRLGRPVKRDLHRAAATLAATITEDLGPLLRAMATEPARAAAVDAATRMARRVGLVRECLVTAPRPPRAR